MFCLNLPSPEVETESPAVYKMLAVGFQQGSEIGYTEVQEGLQKVCCVSPRCVLVNGVEGHQ